MKKIKLSLISSLLIGFLLSLFYIYPAQSQTTLRIGWWGGSERNAATLKVIKLFEQKYPDIKIKAEYGPFDPPKFTSQYIGGKSPDILQVDFPWLSHFANNGKGFFDIYKLKQYGLNLSGFSDNDLNPLVVNNKLMGLPFAINRRVVMMSKYYLDKYNLPIPKTWDDYKKLGLFLKDKTQGKVSVLYIHGPGFGYTCDIVYPLTLQMYNKRPISNDKKILITEDELTKVLDFYLDLLKSNVFMSATKMVNDTDQLSTNRYWMQGEVFAAFNYPASMPVAIRQEGVNSKENMIAIPIPQIKEGETKGIYNRVAFQWGVNKNAKHLPEITKFLNFYFNDPEAVKAIGFLRGYPINANSLQILKDANMLSGIVYEASTIASTLYANEVSSDSILENVDIERVFDLYMQKVSYGKMTTKEASKKIIQKLKFILKHIK